ncbi:transcription factor-like 5 protein [Aplochiton taeniatus]
MKNGNVNNDQGQVMGTELNLMEMTEVEYTHLQHIIQTHMEAHTVDPDGSEVRFNSSVFAVGSPASHSSTVKVETEYVGSPLSSTPTCDPSTATDTPSAVLEPNQQDQVDIQELKLVLVSDAEGLSGERTPTTCGEVPGSVLAKVRSTGEETQEESSVMGGTPARPNPPARVRLEKRFNCSPCDIPRQQDAQSAALSNFLTMLHQSTEAQEAAMYPQMQKWMRSDHANPIELSHPYGGGMFNPIAGMRGHGFGSIPHMLEPNKHQGLIIPKNFSFSYRPERMTAKGMCINRTNSSGSPTEEHVWAGSKDVAESKPAPPAKRGRTRGPRHHKVPNVASGQAELKASGSAPRKRAVAPVESSQRRERHNSKERDRRRRIRHCCDELNLLVPFCNNDTDKATTLQWTTTYLKYITEVYGDSIKQDFQNTFCGKTGLRLKPADIDAVQISLRQGTPGTPIAPQAAEQ